VDPVRYVFYRKDLKLNEMLYHIKSQFADLLLFFNSSSFRSIEQFSLVIQTNDTMDWRLFDYSSDLQDVFSNFEEIYVKAIPIEEYLILQNNPILSHKKAKIPAKVASTAGGGSLYVASLFFLLFFFFLSFVVSPCLVAFLSQLFHMRKKIVFGIIKHQ
jgi:hypothetical protein